MKKKNKEEKQVKFDDEKNQIQFLIKNSKHLILKIEIIIFLSLCALQKYFLAMKNIFSLFRKQFFLF